jgi:hypothetical protein
MNTPWNLCLDAHYVGNPLYRKLTMNVKKTPLFFELKGGIPSWN